MGPEREQFVGLIDSNSATTPAQVEWIYLVKFT